MKKFIPLLLIGALVAAVSCRQVEELDANSNKLNATNVSLKESMMTTVNSTSSDSLSANSLIESDGNKPPRKETQDW